jgi:hypothetical protein
VELKLQKSCGCGSGVFYDKWDGYFKFIKAERWDAYNKRVSFKPETVNPFTDILENWNTEIDLLTLPLQRVVTYPGCELIYYRDGIGVSDPTPDYGGVSAYVGRWDTGYRGTNPGNPNFDPLGIIYGEIRAVVKYTGGGVPPVGPAWFLSSDGNYYRLPYTKSDYEYDTAYFDNKVPDLREGNLPENVVFEKLLTVLNFDRANGVRLADAVAYVFAPFSAIVSNFFSINPDGNNPTNTAYIFAEDYLADAVLFRESTVITPDASNLATALPVEPGAFIEDLQKLGVVFWYEPGTDTLRIEHESYTRFKKGADFVETRLAEVKKAFWFEEDETEFPRFELWQWARDDQEYKLMYSAKCASSDGVPIQFTLMSGNLLYLYENKELTDNGGFVLVGVKDIATGEIYAEIVIEEIQVPVYNYSTGGFDFVTQSFNISKINEPFLIQNVIEDVGFWNRPLLIGTTAEGVEIAMNSRAPNKSNDIEISMNCENYDNNFSYVKKYKTPMGWGQVDTAEYSERRQKLKLKLRY